MEESIQKLKQTYILLDELEGLIKPANYLELVKEINRLISDGIIARVGNGKLTNGRIPPLCIKYRIIRDRENDLEIEKEIKHLSPEFKVEKYLKNKETYKKQREEVQKLDYFFKNQKEKLNIRISKNERAYQIWGYEKMLDTSLGKSIISFNGLEERLNFYLTPEPFFDYILNLKDRMTMLVIENKDTWYTLRKILRNSRLKKINILGVEIDGIIYGEGNKITKLCALDNYEREILSSNVEFIYWGDLDFSGIDIYERVKAANLKSDIKLFTKIYEKMLELSTDKELIEIMKEQNRNINLSVFLNEFLNVGMQNKIKEILNNNRYIPQEILNYEELEKVIKGDFEC